MSETKSSIANSNDNEFDDISSFSSIDSYKPEPFTGVETPSDTHALDDVQDTRSRGSASTLQKPTSNSIEKVVSQNAIDGNAETAQELKKEGLDLKNKAVPDINAPINAGSDTAQFPEEYRIETETGLVKLKTLNDLSRNDTRVSVGSNGKISRKGSQGQKSDISRHTNETKSTHGKSDAEPVDQSLYDPHNVEETVERNRQKIAKYQKHKHEKGLKGFVHRLFD